MDTGQIIQSAGRVIGDNPVYRTLKTVGESYMAPYRAIDESLLGAGRSYVSNFQPLAENLGLAAASKDVEENFNRANQTYQDTLQRLDKQITRSSGVQKTKLKALYDETARMQAQNIKDYQKQIKTASIGNVLGNAGRAGLATVGSLGMAGMPAVAVATNLGVGGALGGAINALQKKPIVEGIESGVGQAPLYTGVGMLGKAIMGPVVKSIAPTQIDNLRRALEFREKTGNLTSYGQLGLDVGRNILARGMEGAAGGVGLGAIQNAETEKERIENMLKYGLTGGAFSAGVQAATYGTQAGGYYGQKGLDFVRESMPTQQPAFYAGEKATGFAEEPRKFSFLTDKQERVMIGNEHEGALQKIKAFLNNAKLNLITKGNKNTEVALSEVFDAPSLYENYPEMRNYKIRFYNAPDQPEAGWSNAPTKTMGVNLNKSAGFDDVKNTLTHEIEHQIQHKEGFAIGANPISYSQPGTAVPDKITMKPGDFTKYFATPGEAEARDVEILRGMTPEARLEYQPLSQAGPIQGQPNSRGLDFKFGDPLYRGVPPLVKPKSGQVYTAGIPDGEGGLTNVLGKATYMTPDKAVAKRFASGTGPIEHYTNDLKNPLILNKDTDFWNLKKAILDKRGSIPDPLDPTLQPLFGAPKGSVAKAAEELQQAIKDLGYDGVEVNLDGTMKTSDLQKYFQDSQVIKFDKSKPTSIDFKIKPVPGQMPMFSNYPEDELRFVPKNDGTNGMWVLHGNQTVEDLMSTMNPGSVRQEFKPTAYQRHQDILGDRLLEGLSRVSGNPRQSFSPPAFGTQKSTNR